MTFAKTRFATGFARRLISLISAAPLFFGALAQASSPSVVIDVASGQILEQEQPTASWYPASLTKLMTVYVALDAVRQNRLSLDTPLLVSPRATRMAPSKMGFRAGSQVTLKNALIMLMVKSANDIAVTIAEGVSGSVEAFAEDMNKASAKLGMRESYWVNPNGLPDSRQVTSARDLALLGRAHLTQFPEQAGLFNIGAMQLGRSIIPTHNGLLGRYPGADGMKTGFTCPAGFNLVASATRGGRKLIAVVLGAPTAAARTAKAAALLDRAFSTPGGMGSIEALESIGVAQAPDMRDSVCRHRGKAVAEFMAGVEDAPIAMGGGTGLFDTGGAQPHLTAKQVAQLPRPHFAPVQVSVGPVEGYAGPVARARAPGAPVGQQPDLAAYAEPEAAPAGASPIAAPAADAKALRGRPAKAVKGKKAARSKHVDNPGVAPIAVEDAPDADKAAPAEGAAETKQGKKAEARKAEQKAKTAAAKKSAAKQPIAKQSTAKKLAAKQSTAKQQLAKKDAPQNHAGDKSAGKDKTAKPAAKQPAAKAKPAPAKPAAKDPQ